MYAIRSYYASGTTETFTTYLAEAAPSVWTYEADGARLFPSVPPGPDPTPRFEELVAEICRRPKVPEA